MRLVWWVGWAVGWLELASTWPSGPQVLRFGSSWSPMGGCGATAAAAADGGATGALAGVHRRDRQRVGVLREQAELAACQSTYHLVKLLVAATTHGDFLLGVEGSGEPLLSDTFFFSSVSAWRPVTPTFFGVHVDSQNPQFKAAFGDLGLPYIFGMEFAWSWVALIRICLWSGSYVCGSIACGCFVVDNAVSATWRIQVCQWGEKQ